MTEQTVGADSCWLRARCTNAQLTIWLANRGLTLTAQLTRYRVARSTVS